MPYQLAGLGQILTWASGYTGTIDYVAGTLTIKRPVAFMKALSLILAVVAIRPLTSTFAPDPNITPRRYPARRYCPLTDKEREALTAVHRRERRPARPQPGKRRRSITVSSTSLSVMLWCRNAR